MRGGVSTVRQQGRLLQQDGRQGILSCGWCAAMRRSSLGTSRPGPHPPAHPPTLSSPGKYQGQRAGSAPAASHSQSYSEHSSPAGGGGGGGGARARGRAGRRGSFSVQAGVQCLSGQGLAAAAAAAS